MEWNEALKLLTSKGQPFELVEVQALGRTVRAFANAPATLRDLFAQSRSDATFIVYNDERLTYEDVWRRSAKLACVMARDYGIAKGDRVAIAMRNYPEWVIAFNAATSIGAIAVGMNALWQSHEVQFALNDSGPKLIMADQERLDRLAQCADLPAGLRMIAVRATKDLPPGVADYTEIMSRAETTAFPNVDVAPDDDTIILYTSGSAGYPKGVVSTHRNIISALLSWELDGQACMLSGIAQTNAANAEQPGALLAIPLFHVSGLHHNLLASYRAQRRLIFMYKWQGDLAADLIEREKATMVSAPSAMTADLLAAVRRRNRSLPSLAVVGGGGAARAPEQVRALARSFPGAIPASGWGMTETNGIGAFIAGTDYLAHPESSGRVSAVLDLRIVDEAGNILPPLSRGEVQIRGASIMRGYWRNPDADAEAFVDGWMRTGDVAFGDNEGFVYIVDRLKDLVIRGGENIGCGTVEAALLEHPDIREASVYGVPDERLGEEVGATLYAERPIDEEELRAFLAPKLARFAIPRYFYSSAEPLPRIASGKILKRQLREDAARRANGSK